MLTAGHEIKDRREVKRTLIAGATSDAIDIGIAIFALNQGQMSRMGAGMFGGGAALLLLLGMYGLKSLE